MKHKTWFRLVLKAVGILLIGFGAPSIVERVSYTWVFFNTGTSGDELLRWSLHVLGPVLQTAFGLYLLFGGAWVANLCIRSNRPYCAECGYELAHVESKRCPECGMAVAQPAPASD